ncbi:cache domain-containing sensor histidine kinase [Cohnella caldifontis]|uniref:cache domain-containing sensor histidine kinase n=1 Tax=Cohnella caldifontis TaxID=3027471 RepID=UPI0023EBFD86|nr:sensor histidine kinase [Cohnella sp. YIM B05605]
MKFWQSVRFRTVFVFFLIVAPLVVFLIYNNLYATRIVRDQVSLHYNNLMAVQVRANDEVLKSTYNFLIQLGIVNDSDLLQVKTLSPEDPDFTLAKLRVYNRFVLDTSYYKMVDTFFAFSNKDNLPFFATQDGYKSPELDAFLKDYATTIAYRQKTSNEQWELVSIPGASNYLVKVVGLDFGLYAGALLRLDTLNSVLQTFDVGPEGAVYMVDSQGNVLTSGDPPPGQDAAFRAAILHQDGSVKSIRWNDKSYLAFTQPSHYADLHYVIVTTEPYILKNLPFFQKMLYFWIPLLSAAVVTGYVLFLQRFMFRPLVSFIGGMRKLGRGQFNVRLPAYPEGSEFSIMATTFNHMAQQIEELKIDVYEEQLRVQRAEYKHLQVQINPHFYMNSLNIIYNLAALKDFKSVQKLSLHLADYFRFLMHSHRTAVRLEDEIRHIGHYMEIQKLRYLDKLEYEISVSPKHLPGEISPLLLQPFVENAILHGFNQRKQDGTAFRVSIVSEDDPLEPDRYVRLTIRDNGPGFPPAMLEDLNNGTYLEGSGEQHLGIWNILRRFKMLYGDEGGISFRNGDGDVGAIVEVRLPVNRRAMLEDSGARQPDEENREGTAC